MNKLILTGVLALLMVSMAGAQTNTDTNVDTVILASTANYPDAMIAGPVSEKLGYPVMLTDKDQLSDSTKTSLEEASPGNIIVLGGPSVISEDVETEVSNIGNVTRLWGTTQTGTSIEVADYFWPEGSEEAVIVQYPLGDEAYHSFLGTVKNEAEDRPILISKEGTLSASVVTAVQDLGATEVDVYSTNAVNVTTDLEAAGVTEVNIEEAEREQLEEQIRERTQVQNKSELVIVAAANFGNTISVPNNPNSASYIVSSESQIDGAVTLANEADADTRIKVVGNPQFARQIVDRIESETDREVEQVSGSPEDVAATEFRNNRQKWKEVQNRREYAWNRMNDALEKNTNKTLRKASRVIDANSSEESQHYLERARTAYNNGHYMEARRLAIAAYSHQRLRVHADFDSEDVREAIKDEHEDMREAAHELREENREFAEEMREAETREERLEIIREFREERRELGSKFREKVRDRDDDFMGRNRDDDDEEERREETEKTSENGEESRLRFRLDGSEVEIDAEFTGRTGGYTVEKSMNVEGNTVTARFDFNSPDGAATQAITEYEEEVEETLEDGSYKLKAELYVDGELRETVVDGFDVPGEVRLSSETKADDDSEETETEDNETESETEAEVEADSDDNETSVEAEFGSNTTTDN